MGAYHKVINSFSFLVIFYIILTFFIKSSELIFTLLSGAPIEDFSGFIYGNLISALFISLCIFIIYFLISFLSEKVAKYSAAILFSTMSLCEIALIIYHKTTGLLFGTDLLNRPLWEMLLTIKSVANFWTTFIAILAIVSLTYAFIKISDRKIRDFYSKTTMFLIFLSIPMILLLSPNQDKNIVNKIWFCLHSNITESKSNTVSPNGNYKLSQVEFNQSYIDKYKALYPNRTIINDHYPLERKDNIANVLGSYFNKVDTKPNIVFIIVESLGSDFLRSEKYGYSMTPFLDSLSRHSLLWSNCLSTTPRSAGVLPAITASVPHGSKGFQFGDIPACNSLLPILKENGYTNNVFYACPFSFDRISDYLSSQNIDYMSPFKNECNQNKDKDDFDYTSWGYHDKKMFERSSEIIGERNDNSPNLDIFITISQHDNKLVLRNKDLEKYYYDKAETLLRSMPENEYKRLKGRKGFITAFLYSDDALKDFFHSYTKQYDNTIFIITGDHSLNINYTNPLNAYHVPLIIWSPSIKKPQHFHSVVSHNDIAPSLTALLRDNFNLDTPENIHWISDGLDTTQNFTSNAITYFMTQTNSSTNLLFNDLYYTEDNNDKKLYKVLDNLYAKAIDDAELAKAMKERMEIIQYIDNYTYTNNCISINPIIPDKKYKLIKSVNIDSVLCTSGKEKPSVSGIKNVNIHSSKIKPGYSDIKVIFTADMKYTADIHHQHFINMNIKCNNADWYPDVISKNIVEKDYRPDEWLRLEITKVFDLQSHNKESKLNFYLTPSEHDSQWNPDHTVLLKNINISILGVSVKN